MSAASVFYGTPPHPVGEQPNGIQQVVGGEFIEVITLLGVASVNNTGVVDTVAGSGIQITGARQTPTVTNTGVLDLTAGSGIIISGTKNNYTIANSGAGGGVTSIASSGLNPVTGAINLTSGDQNTLTITGDAPNNTINFYVPPVTPVTLTAGTGITVGTGPNYTITNTAPAIEYTAGTGIGIDGNNVISNTGVLSVSAGTGGVTVTGTATDPVINIPDAPTPVTLTAGTGITVGTGPNYTITNTEPAIVYTAGTGIGIDGNNVIGNTGVLTLNGVKGSVVLTSSNITITPDIEEETITLTAPAPPTLTAGTGITVGTAPDYLITNTEPAIVYTAGTGIDISVGNQISNTGVTSIIAGTGINVDTSTGAVTVTNSNPTPVTLTAGSGISVGTGPNYTVTNSNPTPVTLTAGTGITVGTGPNYTVTNSNPTPTTQFSYNVYVSGISGNDTTGNGSIGYPYATLARAVTFANTISDANPLIINLACGTYNESANITRDNTYITGGSTSLSSATNVNGTITFDMTGSSQSIIVGGISSIQLQRLVVTNNTAKNQSLVVTDCLIAPTTSGFNCISVTDTSVGGGNCDITVQNSLLYIFDTVGCSVSSSVINMVNTQITVNPAVTYNGSFVVTLGTGRLNLFGCSLIQPSAAPTVAPLVDFQNTISTTPTMTFNSSLLQYTSQAADTGTAGKCCVRFSNSAGVTMGSSISVPSLNLINCFLFCQGATTTNGSAGQFVVIQKAAGGGSAWINWLNCACGATANHISQNFTARTPWIALSA